MTDRSVGTAAPSDPERRLCLDVPARGGQLGAAEAERANQAALAGLVAGGLLAEHPSGFGYIAFNPRAVSGRISLQLREAGVRLPAQADSVPVEYEELTRAFDEMGASPLPTGSVEHVRGLPGIQQRLFQLESEAREEILSAQPGGARPPSQLEHARERTRQFAARGGTARILYEPAAVDDPETSRYAAWAADFGLRTRVLGEPFRRAIIFDRRVAVLPGGPDHESAVCVADPAVVHFLVEAFERDWQRATRVNWSALHATSDPDPFDRTIGDLLADGLTQYSIGARLGLGERTVAGHTARLRKLYDAETLFQLGRLMRDG